MVTIALASAVPLMAGVLSLVMPPSAMVTGEPPLLFCSSRSSAGCGAVASTTTVKVEDGELTLPTSSVTVAVSVCEPSVQVGELKLQVPPAVAVVEPITVVPS